MGMAQQKKIKNAVKSPKLFEKLLFILFIGIIILNVGSTIWKFKAKYLSSNYWQNFPALEKVFLDSQYVNKHAKGFIPDEVAFSYAGGKLIKGTSPVLVVPDAPPLGKYIIGLSTILFNNDSTFILVSAILSLILLYFLSLQIFNNKLLAILPPFFLSFEAIFKNQLAYAPLMDIFQVVFLLCMFLFFNKGLTSKKSLVLFILASTFLGLFIATKFFITGFTIIAAWYIVLFFARDKRKIINLTLTLPISLLILLLSYVRVFSFGYTFNKFLGIQKWVFLYHKSFIILPFSTWPLLLLDRWYVWFGNKPVISDAQWSITWPILAVLFTITALSYVFRKIPRNKNIEILMAWPIVYMGFLSLGQADSRYFVILIPILYIVAVFGVKELLKLILPHENK